MLKPAAEWELQSMVGKLAQHKLGFEVVGSGALRGIGRPSQTDVTISTASMRGIALYEPTELVMSARAGTPLADVEAALAARGQMLAFEPVDLAPATGGVGGIQTIGGVFATNLSGARRVLAGSARDHLLGVAAVNGRGEFFRSGGRVMKNVAGYDVARALTGSWGTLAIFTEVTFKVLPVPEATATLVYRGLPDDLGVECLTAALGTPFEVSGGMHLSAPAAARLDHSHDWKGEGSVTCIRVETYAHSLAYRVDKLQRALRIFGAPRVLDEGPSQSFWNDMRTLQPMPYRDSALWRISTVPTKAPKIATAVERAMSVVTMYDWGGGLLWLEVPASGDAGSSDIRRAVAVHGGQATLIRASAAVRAAVDVFEPMTVPVERLSAGLKSAFDPNRLLNPGRMYETL